MRPHLLALFFAVGFCQVSFQLCPITNTCPQIIVPLHAAAGCPALMPGAASTYHCHNVAQFSYAAGGPYNVPAPAFVLGVSSSTLPCWFERCSPASITITCVIAPHVFDATAHAAATSNPGRNRSWVLPTAPKAEPSRLVQGQCPSKVDPQPSPSVLEDSESCS